MTIDIITCVPQLFEGVFSQSIIGKALGQKIAEINLIDLRDYAIGKYRQIDDAPYGGGAGMVLMAEPLSKAIEAQKSLKNYDEVIFFLPEGDKINQELINKHSTYQNVLLVCGHYKGIDQRIVDVYATKKISLGDFVVTGGEIAAMVFCDALIRVMPGAIGNEQSALEDSFQDKYLSPPVYTRPAEIMGIKVPEVLLSGNHAKIEDWKMEQAYIKTKALRPDLLK